MPKISLLVIHEAWICTDIDLADLVIINATQQLNSSTSPPYPLPNIPSQNDLGPLWPLRLQDSSAESLQVIYVCLLFQETRAYCLARQSCSDSLPHPSVSPQSKDFQLLLCRKCQKHYSTIHYPRFCNFSYVFTLIC